MKQYFVDSNNQVFEKEVPNYRALIELRKKYRMATPKERVEFIDGVNDHEVNFAKENNLLDIFYMAPTNNVDGYGNSSVNIKRRIVDDGIHLNTVYTDQKVGLCYHLPNTLSLVKTPIQIAYTMFESDKYPPFWEPWLKQADLVLVPTQFCADVMEDNFKIKPEVVPLGYDPDFFYFLDRSDRPEDHEFTFLHFDAFKWRKGWDLTFTAFNEEFGEDEPVKLVFKTTLGITPPLSNYPKIVKIVGKLPQEEMYEVLRDADCFVFPSRGEGFGLTPLEAMATGLRAIIPNHTGMATYFDNRYNTGLDCVEIDAKYDNTELKKLELGHQWEPTISSLRKAMRAEFEEWKANGKKLDMDHSRDIAEYAKQFTINRTVKELAKVLKRFS